MKVVDKQIKIVIAVTSFSTKLLRGFRVLEMNANLSKPLSLFSEMGDPRTRLTEVETENESLKKGMKYTNGEFEELTSIKQTSGERVVAVLLKKITCDCSL